MHNILAQLSHKEEIRKAPKVGSKAFHRERAVRRNEECTTEENNKHCTKRARSRRRAVHECPLAESNNKRRRRAKDYNGVDITLFESTHVRVDSSYKKYAILKVGLPHGTGHLADFG